MIYLLITLILAVCAIGYVKTRPRPMFLPSVVDKQTFVQMGTQILRKHGYTILPTPFSETVVRAVRYPHQIASIEGKRADNPYWIELIYKPDAIESHVALLPYCVFDSTKYPDILQTLDNGPGTSDAHKEQFVPVLADLRVSLVKHEFWSSETQRQSSYSDHSTAMVAY